MFRFVQIIQMATAEVEASIEVKNVSTDDAAANKTLKAVDMAFDLPVVTSAYAEMAKIASPITVPISTTISPMVEVGMETIKNKSESWKYERKYEWKYKGKYEGKYEGGTSWCCWPRRKTNAFR